MVYGLQTAFPKTFLKVKGQYELPIVSVLHTVLDAYIQSGFLTLLSLLLRNNKRYLHKSGHGIHLKAPPRCKVPWLYTDICCAAPAPLEAILCFLTNYGRKKCTVRILRIRGDSVLKGQLYFYGNQIKHSRLHLPGF